MQRGLSSTGLLPIAVIFSIYIKGRWSGMKAGHPRRTAHRGQTWGLIKAQPSQPQTGFEVRHIKSMGSKVRHRTDLHLTLQLEMVISRCNDDPCLTVRDDTNVGDTRHLCECGSLCLCTHTASCIGTYSDLRHLSWVLLSNYIHLQNTQLLHTIYSSFIPLHPKILKKTRQNKRKPTLTKQAYSSFITLNE